MKHFVLLVILHYYKKLHRETFCSVKLKYETFCSVKVQYETFRSNDTFFEICRSSLKEDLFFIFIRCFNQMWLEYPIFLYIYDTYRFKCLRRLTTDSNH